MGYHRSGCVRNTGVLSSTLTPSGLKMPCSMLESDRKALPRGPAETSATHLDSSASRAKSPRKLFFSNYQSVILS